MKHIKFLTQTGNFQFLRTLIFAFPPSAKIFISFKMCAKKPLFKIQATMILNIVLGGGLTVKRGTFGSVAKLVTMCCVTYGKGEDVCFSGTDTGHVYVWTSNNLQRIVQAHNDGPCFCVSAVSNFEVTFSILTKKISSRERRKSASPVWLKVSM